MGGLGYYSHGNHCLQHQHWVQQVISGGAFGVHCTQAAESKHKVCMHLASVRVRHVDGNKTQSSMLRYMCLRSIFLEMQNSILDTNPVRRRKTSSGVSVILCEMGGKFTTVGFQERFLHREARIARVELLDLLCDKFKLRRTRASYRQLENLSYIIGQKFIRSDGYVLWATDSSYSFNGCNDRRRSSRRDCLVIKHDAGTTSTSFCCESICFLTVAGFTPTGFDIPTSLQPAVVDDSLSFVLGRWFERHPETESLDSGLRPLCPGALNINHCLWRYARAESSRRVLVSRSGPTQAFQRQAGLFGSTPVERELCFQNEKHAYFCLLSPENIVVRANMCPCFLPGTSTPDRSTWLQTVTVI